MTYEIKDAINEAGKGQNAEIWLEFATADRQLDVRGINCRAAYVSPKRSIVGTWRLRRGLYLS